MFDLAFSRVPDRHPGAACGAFMRSGGQLVTVSGFPFPVRASQRERAAARRIARRALAARDLLHGSVGIAPRLSLLVLGRGDWRRHADAEAYGVAHVSSSGDLVVGGEPADAWHAVSDYFARHLAAHDLARLVDVHGLDRVNRRGPALDALAESLIAHEVAHLLADQEGVLFPRRWLQEAFANCALVAALGETDPAGLRLVGSLAEAAATLDARLPTLADFERDFGQMDVAASVLAELAITRGAYHAYATQRTAPLARLFDSFRTDGRARDADYELGRMLAERVHPAIASIPARFASARVAAQ